MQPPHVATACYLDATKRGSERAERRPIGIVVGDADPRCATPILHASAARNRGSVRINVVGGDHNFENRALQGAAADETRNRTIITVARLAADFVSDAPESVRKD